MKQQHTDTPWRVNGGGVVVCGPNGSVCRTFREGVISSDEQTAEAQANAAFIVRAVNSHEKLIEALQNIKADCELAQQRRTTPDWDFATHHAIEYVDAALAEVGAVAGESHTDFITCPKCSCFHRRDSACIGPSAVTGEAEEKVKQFKADYGFDEAPDDVGEAVSDGDSYRKHRMSTDVNQTA